MANRASEKTLAELKEFALAVADPLLSGSRALLVAHGAAVLSCIALIKDAGASPILHSAQYFSACFCAGFGLAAFAQFFAVIFKVGLLQQFLGPDHRDDNFRASHMTWVTVPMLLSFFLLVGPAFFAAVE